MSSYSLRRTGSGATATPLGSPRTPRSSYHEVLLGVALDYAWPARYAFYTFDGFFCWDFREFSFSEEPVCAEAQCVPEELHKAVVKEISGYMAERQLKVVMAGLALNGDKTIRKLGHLLWRELDILPCLISASGDSLDEISCSVARKTANYLSASSLPGNFPRILVGYRHEVECDANGAIDFASLEAYRLECADETWKRIIRLAMRVRQKDLSLVFINSTPQGGGVAILRHSMVRFLRLLGVKVHWFVMRPNPEVFEITKKKFHNVLQAVAPDGTRLSDSEMELWQKWCESNLRTYWRDGPVMQADLIVIDDPQPCGLIPHLKKLNPTAKIAYRSHIELRSDLIDREGTEPQHVWDFLWQFIKQADYFVSHPVQAFVPEKTVREQEKAGQLKLFQIPASTDPIDGLNKPLDGFSVKYYQHLFNRFARDQCGVELDFARPYFIQIARFDPSKGIPDLIRAYVLFRTALDRETLTCERIQEEIELSFNEVEHKNMLRLAPRADCRKFSIEEIPQLVITGHGSIDDPEGNVIYKQVMALRETDWVQSYMEDIVVVRLGPNDQILNALMRNAFVAFQLSIREGFEIKVTEALIKGVPVVAYAAGGIPLQIIHGHDGFLFPPGSIDRVADVMREFVVNPGLRSELSKPQHCRAWLMTPSNAGRWLSIMLNEDPEFLRFPN